MQLNNCIMLSEEHVHGRDGQIILHQEVEPVNVLYIESEGPVTESIKIAASIKYALYLVVSRAVCRYPYDP